jgi:ElaB/YqjD/DUF883 family membrane-anchored ribosome-binding protein
MNRHKRTANDLGTIAQHAQDLVAATADVAGEKVAAARRQLHDALEQGREFYTEAHDGVAAKAQAADEFIRGQPYAALGIGVGLGVLIGLLLRGRD